MPDNFQYNLKLKKFAKPCRKSLSVFKRDFNSYFNTTPYKWVKTKRLEAANKLLVERNLKVNYLWASVGALKSRTSSRPSML